MAENKIREAENTLGSDIVAELNNFRDWSQLLRILCALRS